MVPMSGNAFTACSMQEGKGLIIFACTSIGTTGSTGTLSGSHS